MCYANCASGRAEAVGARCLPCLFRLDLAALSIDAKGGDVLCVSERNVLAFVTRSRHTPAAIDAHWAGQVAPATHRRRRFRRVVLPSITS